MNSSNRTRTLTTLGILTAIILVMSFTPLGYIKTLGLEITLLHIPVILGAALTGPVGGMVLGGGAEAFADDPARCGTFPQVATLGYSVAAAQVQGGSADVFAVEPVRSGDGSVCGIVPRAATVGYSTGAAQRGQAAVAVYAATPRRCGTFRCGQQ